MSKFVGKFRKNKDYKDDHNYARDFLKGKHHNDEEKDVKKKILKWERKNHDFSHDDFFEE